MLTSKSLPGSRSHSRLPRVSEAHAHTNLSCFTTSRFWQDAWTVPVMHGLPESTQHLTCSCCCCCCCAMPAEQVVQHSLDHERLPCLPELQHAAGSRASCKAPPGNVAVLLARLGSPRKQRSGISPPGSGPSEAGNKFLEAASCHEQVLVGPDVLEPHHADAGAAAGCAAVQERPLGSSSTKDRKSCILDLG